MIVTNVLEARGLSKIFGGLGNPRIRAVRDVNLSIGIHDFVVILGPSGGGKSTLLRLFAGILKPTAGTIEKYAMNGTSPEVGLVFQSDGLFPWMRVWKNLTYALGVRGASNDERRKAAAEMCLLLGIPPESLTKYPRELSGGQQRRVSVGMNLSRRPDLLLLDEPTSQLDYVTRLTVQQFLQRLWTENKFATVLVTHDIDEALLLGDRVLFLREGRLEESLDVPFPRPRTDALRTTAGFAELRTVILGWYSKEISS